jgi:hypothetical protein
MGDLYDPNRTVGVDFHRPLFARRLRSFDGAPYIGLRKAGNPAAHAIVIHMSVCSRAFGGSLSLAGVRQIRTLGDLCMGEVLPNAPFMARGFTDRVSSQKPSRML